MTSITRHHAEWLSLLEISGPFLSMPVLLQAFPQGLEAHDPDLAGELRAAYEEWADNQSGVRPDPAIHTAWVRFVMERALGYTDEVLLTGQALPAGIKAEFPEHGETLRPEIILVPPFISGEGGDKEHRSEPRLLIQVYPPSQSLEKPPQGSRWQASVATRMMELLHASGVRLGLVTNGEQWMLVDAPRGDTTGFTSWYASLWFEEQLTLRAFRSLLGTRRFFGVPDDQTLDALLATSAQDQYEVTDQLGYQVRRAVEILIQSIDKADQDRGQKIIDDPERLYEAALTVMMRLVFLLCAEERKLLPLDDPFYADNYAISTLRAQLREQADRSGEEVLERRYDAWCRLLATFRAVHGGIRHDRLTLPAYGGSLFDPERFPFLEGRKGKDDSSRMTDERGMQKDKHGSDSQIHPSSFVIHPLSIDNRTVLHLLEALQVLQVKVPGGGPAEARRLSFRALDVEQIGHVYEGLLDHHAVRASEPVLGLAGTRDKEPEIRLSELEARLAKDDKSFIDYLSDQTGRSTNALRKNLAGNTLTFDTSHLRASTGNDETLYRRVLPFARLIRDDNFGIPVIIPIGSVYVTAGTTRRATGTHYTPRSLTEPIVQHTLEPLVYRGPAEGWPREKWELRSPAELLDLKICDMAMGSAGFLVQADRYMAERLVEAWEIVEQGLQTQGIRNKGIGANDHPAVAISDLPFMTPEGHLTDDPAHAIPATPDERMIYARRLVAERCLYGVDKNPLAVEIAKLSLWLATLARERPFTFLDHALKCGDSLVGTSEDDFLRWAHGWQAAEATLFDATLQEQVETARQKRRELETFQVLDVRDAERKAELLAEAEAALKRVKRGCDLLEGARLLGLSENDTEELQIKLLFPYMAGEEEKNSLARDSLATSNQVHAFHWEFEFPEVFEQGGFSAFVGNPPFLGGTKISTYYGNNYAIYLKAEYSSFTGNADLCSLFFIRAFTNIKTNGKYGLIATKTISQGNTSETGLAFIISKGGLVFKADTSTTWPGSAAVVVSVVYILKGEYKGRILLDDRLVKKISPLLTEAIIDWEPKALVANEGVSFNGSKLDGIGFVIIPEEAELLLKRNPQNKDVLFPFLGGQDLNNEFDQKPTRWVINFHEWPLEKAEKYSDCLKIVKERVYPYRQTHSERRTRENWWQYTRVRNELYSAISGLGKVIAISQATKYIQPSLVDNTSVFDQALVLVVSDSVDDFAILNSSIHLAWALEYQTSLGTTPYYIPTKAFLPFPFPNKSESLCRIGRNYENLRRKIMYENQQGLTATYNRFHNLKDKSTEIAHLRHLHVDMDTAVDAAYGWSDLDLGHGFHETAQGVRYTISELARREVLRRLLELNHERYEEEVRQGLHEKKQGNKGKGGKGKWRKVKDEFGQYGLF